MRPSWFQGISFFWVLSFAPNLPAAQIVLTSSADTCIQEKLPNNNMGGSDTLMAGNTRRSGAAGTTRGLISFNVAGAIPAGAQITSARFEITVSKAPSGAVNSTFELRRVLRAWAEGSKTGLTGATASAGECTWNTPWSTGGGAIGTDYSSTISASTTVSGLDRYTFTSPELIAEVQSMLDTPAQNFGWLLGSQMEDTPVTVRRFGTKEGSFDPTLTVEFETSQPPHDMATVSTDADTGLFEASPDNNLGTVPYFPLGVNGNSEKARGLLRFDLSAIPPGSKVFSATLNLSVSLRGTGATTADYHVHRVLASWDEGNKTGGGNGSAMVGAPASPGEATWNARHFEADLWAQPGGMAGSDFSSSSSATINLGAVGRYMGSSSGLVSDVQEWLDHPESNLGWIILAADESGNALGEARRIDTREASSPSNRPTLVVEFDPAPVLFTPFLAGQQFRFTFEAKAGRMYRVERRTVLGTGSWSVHSNVPPQQVTGPVTIFDLLGAEPMFYRAGLE